jgi:hypothetical protein
MTIEKGKEWGTPSAIPSRRVFAKSDRELANATSDDIVSVVGGDVWRALGMPVATSESASGMMLPLDALVVSVTAEGVTTTVLAASCVEIGRWRYVPLLQKRSRYVCISNAGLIGERSVAPRAHPNDGKFEVMTLAGEMDVRQRRLSYKRSRMGTHVPHPFIEIKQTISIEIARQGAHEILHIDHIHISKWDSISVAISPDHWHLFV